MLTAIPSNIGKLFFLQSEYDKLLPTHKDKSYVSTDDYEYEYFKQVKLTLKELTNE